MAEERTRLLSVTRGLVGFACATLLVACSSGATSSPPSSTRPGGSTAPDSSGTVWLCKPGAARNPCSASLTATVVRADGTTSIERATPAKNAPIDCFYVYPTVSRQTTENANLDVDPEETAVAIAQASRFSQVCNVYAPMYRQLTLSAIGTGKTVNAKAAAVAYLSVLAAWKDYLSHDNHGRGVVLIGHSQGSSLLIPLIRNEIDSDPTERKLLVSALLMGGNLTVPSGQTVGGDFKNVPTCQSDAQTGCVVAYSSFDSPPPADSLFGRVGTGISARAGLGQPAASGLQIVCTNPASLSGGVGALEPYFPTSSVPGARGNLRAPIARGVSTPWVTYPDLYTGACQNSNGASWLQVDTTGLPGDHRPVVSQTLGPRWGLHLVDVNIALGNLVTLVGTESHAYTSGQS